MPRFHPEMPLDGLLDELRRPTRPDMPDGWQRWPVAHEAHKILAREAIAAAPPCPDRFDGRGIVACAGGTKYFTGAWVLVRMLRHMGCRLPVQFWHFPDEVDDRMRAMVAPLGVECVDIRAVEAAGPSYLRRPLRGGWETKVFAIVHCPFREVLLLDADNVPVLDPTDLFDAPEYREHGSAFWPDFGRLAADRAIWDICEVAYRDEPEFETGQVLVDKSRCWPELMLTMHYNDYSEFYFDHVHGDKETFHLAWRRLGRAYAMPARGIHSLDATMCQHDFLGRRIFQHRNMDKWRLDGGNRRIGDFWHEEDCSRALAELRGLWSGRPFWSPPRAGAAARLAGARFLYHRVGHDVRPMRLLAGGLVGEGAAACERRWSEQAIGGRPGLVLDGDDGPICHLASGDDGTWRGRWLKHERMPVEMVPLPDGGAAATGGRPVVFHAHLYGYGGYGQMVDHLGRALESLGVPVAYRPCAVDRQFVDLSPFCHNRVVDAAPAEWTLLTYSPEDPIPFDPVAWLTMWEATRVRAEAVANLNRAGVLIVPCRWNADNFRAQGVTRPIRVVPLGIDPAEYHPAGPPPADVCRFGAAGRVAHGGPRKGIADVVDAFLAAFPTEPDVRLTVKIWPDCPLAEPGDPRVEIVRRPFSTAELADWYRSLTAFVSASRGEGFGLQPLQAMACGRPLVCAPYSGQAEYFDAAAGYALDYDEVEAGGYYAGRGGLWALPRRESLIARLREVRRDRDAAARKGEAAATIASAFTWTRSAVALRAALTEAGMLPAPP